MAKVNVRLMDRPEDYTRMGTKQGQIEVWEDGKRDDDRRRLPRPPVGQCGAQQNVASLAVGTAGLWRLRAAGV